MPATLPIAASPSVDVRVLLFAVALTGLVGLAFGLAPVLRAGREVWLAWLVWQVWLVW